MSESYTKLGPLERASVPRSMGPVVLNRGGQKASPGNRCTEFRPVQLLDSKIKQM